MQKRQKHVISWASKPVSMTIAIDNSLRLELTAQKHATALQKAVDANRDHLSEFLPWVGNMKTVEDAATYISECEERYRKGQEVSFVITDQGQTVGRAGLHHMQPQNQYAEIGYWLVKNAEGRGIMTRSCQALLKLAFADLHLHRIVIKAAGENRKSRAIAEKLGFVQEGILREAELVHGRFLDLAIYSILRSEWPN